MMDQKPVQAQKLWVRTSSVQDGIREPKQKSSSVESPAPNRATTQLNANAPEFVPAWLQPPTAAEIEQKFHDVHITIADAPLQYPPKHSAQSRLNSIKSPQNQEQSSACYNPPELPNGYYNKDESPDMMRMKQIISSLIMYPGQFDDLLMVFMETMYPYFNDVMAMSEIAQLLVGQAINCPNFRYNGVRLCWYVEQKCPEFRAALHLQCQKELHDNPNQQNVVLFIAELYTQLPHDSLYGTLLIDSLKKLLVKGESESIKCVCQGLKLTGYSLEQNHKQALNDLFTQLGDFRNSTSGTALILLNSVINLRDSNWGRTNEESSHSDSSDYDQDYEEMVKGILYETDGQVLTTEEQEFLVANATHDEYMIDNEDPDALCNPEPEMDEEIQAAFEEFVKLSKAESD